jgi:predicted dehydrogenase
VKTRGNTPVRLLVAGVGHLGSLHARIAVQNARAKLRGLVDSDLERARKLAQELGCGAWPDAGSALAELEAVDAVVVATPTRAHASVAVPLLERGIACLVEKPIASTADEARSMLAAARRGGALLSVGHVERFQPGLRKLLELGLEPRFLECHRLAPFSFRSTDIGVVHDLMIHDLDLVLELVRSPLRSFDAAGGAILTEREDVASVRLVFENGARANVTASRASLQPMRRLRLFSSSAYVSLDFQKNYGLLVRKGPGWEAGRRSLQELSPADLAARAGELSKDLLEIVELELGGERPLQAEVEAFLAAVQGQRELEVTGDDGLRALELAEAISAAIRAQGF